MASAPYLLWSCMYGEVGSCGSFLFLSPLCSLRWWNMARLGPEVLSHPVSHLSLPPLHSGGHGRGGSPTYTRSVVAASRTNAWSQEKCMRYRRRSGGST
ncbi:hypothetical protein DAI22_10g085600 [Oryza sativa Japonica Group]|nr:hypothetical protein DAI22_10g085600 [Oryza sativa Japonica Group]